MYDFDDPQPDGLHAMAWLAIMIVVFAAVMGGTYFFMG